MVTFLSFLVCVIQLLSKALMECHEEADKAGQRLALEVFVAGRNRLENEGAIALSEVFEVGLVIWSGSSLTPLEPSFVSLCRH